jgi:hypothetical protein
MTLSDYLHNATDLMQEQMFVNDYLQYDTMNLIEIVCMHKNDCLNLYINKKQTEINNESVPVAIHIAKVLIVSLRHLDDRKNEAIIFNTLSSYLYTKLDKTAAKKMIAEVCESIIGFENYKKRKKQELEEMIEEAKIELSNKQSNTSVLR